MAIIRRSVEELDANAIARIIANTDLQKIKTRGTFVREILRSINTTLGQLYTDFDIGLAQSLISRAEGVFLDGLGDLFAIKRMPNERDDNFRFRITNQVLELADTNATAIRLQILVLDNIRDAIVRDFTFGIGSFQVFVLPETGPLSDMELANTQQVIDEHKALGVYGIATKPIEMAVDINLQVLFRKDTNLASRPALREAVKLNIINYIDTLSLGDTIIFDQLISISLNTSSDILDINITEMRINEDLVLFRDYIPNEDELLIPGTINVT